jgi:simple sugar transport system permease protein
MNVRSLLETLTITVAALAVSVLLFGAYMAANGVNPLDLYYWLVMGGFGSAFAWKNTLSQAAPLILTALCTALPARLGLIVIGAEGSLVLGGLASVLAGLAAEHFGAPPLVVQGCMCVAGMCVGALLIALVGGLSHWRGVNATISSLLVTYIALYVFNYLVEGPFRDPASLNKPSTYPIADANMIGTIPGLGVHWGLVMGVVFCLLAYVLMDHTTFGFAARVAGGNIRAARVAGLPVGRLILVTCAIGGAAAGLAGAVEVGAVQRQANGALVAGYGFTGILVAFIARQHPLAIIPAAVLFGGLEAANGVLQRRLLMPDASVRVLMGMIFVIILLFDTLYGRFRVFQPREVKEVAPA